VETGCDRGEAELALEMCGYEVEKAVRQIPRLLRDICALKGKFVLPAANQQRAGARGSEPEVAPRSCAWRAGDLLRPGGVVLDQASTRNGSRSRSTYTACRLWDGSLPAESLDIEQGLVAHFRAAPPEDLRPPARGRRRRRGRGKLAPALRAHFQDPGFEPEAQKGYPRSRAVPSSLRRAPPNARRGKPAAEDAAAGGPARAEDRAGGGRRRGRAPPRSSAPGTWSRRGSWTGRDNRPVSGAAVRRAHRAGTDAHRGADRGGRVRREGRPDPDALSPSAWRATGVVPGERRLRVRAQARRARARGTGSWWRRFFFKG